MQEAEAIKVKVGDWTISAYSLQQESQRQILFTHRLMAEAIGRSKTTAQKFCKQNEAQLPTPIQAIVPDKPRPVALSTWEAALEFWQEQGSKGNTTASALALAATAGKVEVEPVNHQASDSIDIEGILAALPSGEGYPSAAEREQLDGSLELIARWLKTTGIDEKAIAQWKLNILAGHYPMLKDAVTSATKLLAVQDEAQVSGMIASQVAKKVSESLNGKVTAAQVNQALHDLNLQEWVKSGSRERKLTEKGKQYGRAMLVTSKTNAWSGAQLRWFESVIPVLSTYFQEQNQQKFDQRKAKKT